MIGNGSRSTILVTVRTNGAAAAMAWPVKLMCQRFNTLVLCGSPERRRILLECAEAGAATFLVTDKPTPADVASILREHSPSLCVRSTPSSGEGPDEWLAGALRAVQAQVPIVALQDDPGVGRALNDATIITVVDEEAKGQLDPRLRRRSRVIGWTAYDGMAEGPGPLEARLQGRASLSLPMNQQVAMYLTGAGGGAPEADNLTLSLRALQQVPESPLLLVKPHPRLGAEAEALRSSLAGRENAYWASGELPQRAWLVLADVLLSANSSMHRDLAAYQSLWAQRHPDFKAIAKSIRLPPSSSGSQHERLTALRRDLIAAFHHPEEPHGASSHGFPDASSRPDGNASLRLLQLIDGLL
jgi:hypothetical protein